ncbi:hypothetical protein A2943_02240 [Candidatus Adlerbacteria bacterium RIFCSPLOWO2_01_FULL_51_16]|uniref:Prepilin-type N-terminal cleavage/methylation domain-containing protein n=1 Tax=Candidatus Adlerbacteria bacterium RIFCSPLOWO2_01_FULL_51_16 TaxID=1797243 RepID=A0A1F4XG93_9BACT|nr:MAG: hypothetical protein A2943_02240 [Candidatus Adlerbacteria bacterium RIFCSPLOWO2_01_FULL_51_16]
MQKGFTLIELLVSVGIFTVVMVIALGALLSIAESDRKAQTLKTVTNNLNFALDSMSRTIRIARDYDCNSGGDCTTGAGSFMFRATNGNLWGYRWESSACVNTLGCIQRTTDAGASWEDITAPEVVVLNCGIVVTGACTPGTRGLTFYLFGSTQADAYQPRLIVTLQGYVQQSTSMRSHFHLQTTITQRLYDQ